MEKCTIQQAIYLGILFKASRGPNVSGHFDPDRHGLLSRANGELVGRRQRRPTLPSWATDVLFQHSSGPAQYVGYNMVGYTMLHPV